MATYLMDFYDYVSDEQIAQYFAANQCTVVKTFSNLNKVYLVECGAVPAKTDIVECVTVDDHTTALNLLDVVTIHNTPPSEEHTLDSSQEKDWWKIYSLKNVDYSTDLINTYIWGDKVNVYLVDSGIDASHPEFQGCDITNIYSITGEFGDTKGHGTALASVIVGNSCSMTTAALKIVKIFETGRQTLQSELLAAFDAILADAANSTNKFSVVNLSWAIPKNQYIEQKIRLLINRGVCVVAAAGNSGMPIADVTPAGMIEVLTVGSYNDQFLPSNFSDYTDPTETSLTQNLTNHGELDCWAPGEKIWVAKVGGGYGYTAGTSLSAAILSGAVAYNMSKFQHGGDVISIFRTLDGVFIYNNMDGVYRQGLLDLSDPKYAASKNYICTYKNEFREKTLKIQMPLQLKAKVNEQTWAMFFAMATATSYELLDPLPHGVRVERNYFIFNPTQELPNTDGVLVSEVRYKVTTTDGQVYTNSCTFYQVGSAFDRDKLPPDDPLLDVQLLDIYPYPPCGTVGVGMGCYNPNVCNVNASQCVTPSGPKGTVCSCVTG